MSLFEGGFKHHHLGPLKMMKKSSTCFCVFLFLRGGPEPGKPCPRGIGVENEESFGEIPKIPAAGDSNVKYRARTGPGKNGIFLIFSIPGSRWFSSFSNCWFLLDDDKTLMKNSGLYNNT